MKRAGFAHFLSLTAVGAFCAQTAAFAQPVYPMASMPAAAYARQTPGAAVLPAAMPTGGQTVRVDLGGGGSSSRMMSLPKGKSAMIDLPTDARDVMVSDPKVADVILSTPRRIHIIGMASGQTSASFYDGMGRQILSLSIRVDQDVSSLAETLNRVLPGSTIQVEGLNDSLILSGQVANMAEADKAVRMAQGLVSKLEQVINMLSISAPEQVMLKVRIVEVNRTVIKQLGVNLSALLNHVGEPH